MRITVVYRPEFFLFISRSRDIYDQINTYIEVNPPHI